MIVAVVVPFQGGCPYRERAWGHVGSLYAERHPEWEVVEAIGPEGPWCKGAAANPAVAETDAEIIVFADADCWTDGLPDAVAAIEDGAGWAVPHKLVHRLDEEATAEVLAGEDWRSTEGRTQRAYEGVLGGGFVVARAETLRAVPLDERYVGWGQIDESHALALNALYGKPWRGTADLVHLFHPPQERQTRRRGSRESWALRQRYAGARRDPDAMRALLEEARCPSIA